MQPAIEARALEVVRNGRRALRALAASVRPGSVTGLLGPSGSGKTTFIRCVMGVQQIAAGDVVVLGLPAGSPPLRRRIGYVTQSPSVYADLTVRENLSYFARLIAAARGDVGRVLAEVDLREDADRVVSALSGGQQARVSLAAALLGSPELLVLDEPTVGLDPVLRRELWALFARLAAGGVTLLVSSHVMDEAERCTDLLLLRDGALLAAGTPGELRERTGAPTVEEAFLRMVEETA